MKVNISFKILILITVLWSCSPAEIMHEEVDETLTPIDSTINTFIKSKQLVGLTYGVFCKGEAYTKFFGVTNLNTQEAVNDTTIFSIASLTKQFTAVAIMQLVDKGAIKLTDSIFKYLDVEDKLGNLTIHQLLSHQSGLPSDISYPKINEFAHEKCNMDTLLKWMSFYNKGIIPGEEQIYSNSGYFLLGLVIEKISKSTYQNYIKKNIFDEVGMKNSCFLNIYDTISNLAVGYMLGRNDSLFEGDVYDRTWSFAAADINASISDIVLWNKRLHHEKSLLTTKSYNYLITPNILSNGLETKYGKGFFIDNINGIKVIGHSGALPGFGAFVLYAPEYDVSCVVLANTLGIPQLISGTTKRIIKTLVNKTIPTEPTTKYPSKHKLLKYIGKYKSKSVGMELEIVEIEDSLYLLDGSKQLLIPSKTKLKTWNTINNRITFNIKNDDVISLYLDDTHYCVLFEKNEKSR